MIICLIQARLGSSRLPGKCVKKIDGIPMTSYIIKAAKLSNNITFSGIIFPDKEDDKKIFYDYYFGKCFCFAGDEFDVLSRYYFAVRHIETLTNMKCDHILRLTSDCPLLVYNYYLIDVVINSHKANNNDFTSNRGIKGYPSGLDVEVMTRDTLNYLQNNVVTKGEREHVTLYIQNNKNKFKIGNVDSNMNGYNKKLSIDTIDELKKVEKLLIIYKNNFGDYMKEERTNA